jgi:diacylglycerol kinase family enzyme
MSIDQLIYVFIINPISFRTKSSLEDFISKVDLFFNNTFFNHYIYISKYPRDSISYIRKLYDSFPGFTKFRIYAVGGDGILFDCLNGIAGLSNIELGSFPYGNTNDFIRAFGEGLNEEFQDISNQFNGLSLPTDIIDCGNMYALNSCTIGMESYAVHRSVELQENFKQIKPFFPLSVGNFIYNILYYIGGVLSINNKEIINQNYEILIDNEDLSGNYAIINIANGPCYGGNMTGAIAALPNDGYLDIILFKSTGIINFINKGFNYIYGKYYKYPDLISYYRAKSVSIRSKKPLLLQLDGEVFIDTNIKINIIPNAINFISVRDLTYKPRGHIMEN